MTKEEEIIEKLRFYERRRATMPDRLKTIDYQIEALTNKQVLLKKRRDMKLKDLNIKRNDLLNELKDIESNLRRLYEELKEVRSKEAE